MKNRPTACQRREYPLLWRELDRISRSKGHYWLRSAPALVGTAILTFHVFYDFGWLFGMPASDVKDVISSVFRKTAALYQAFVILGIAPILAARTIAQEKEENTLTLLLLADFRAKDIYASKFLGACIPVWTLLLTVLPLYAMISVLGGMDVYEEVVYTATMLCFSLTICCVGLLVSTVARRSDEALIGTYAIIVFLIFVYSWLQTWVVSYPFLSDFEIAIRFAFCIIIALASALATNALLPQLLYSVHAPKIKTAGHHRKIGEVNDKELPALLVQGAMPSAMAEKWSRPVRIGVGLLLSPLFFFPCLGPAILQGLITYSAAVSIRKACSEGNIELLRLTGITDKSLMQGGLEAIKLRNRYLAAGIALFSIAASGIMGVKLGQSLSLELPMPFTDGFLFVGTLTLTVAVTSLLTYRILYRALCESAFYYAVVSGKPLERTFRSMVLMLFAQGGVGAFADVGRDLMPVVIRICRDNALPDETIVIVCCLAAAAGILLPYFVLSNHVMSNLKSPSGIERNLLIHPDLA